MPTASPHVGCKRIAVVRDKRYELLQSTLFYQSSPMPREAGLHARAALRLFLWRLGKETIERLLKQNTARSYEQA